MPKSLENTVFSREIIWLGAAVFISLLIHGFFIIDGFGESDAARMAIQAAGWHHMGEISILSYSVRTSPLYLHFIKTALDMGFPIQKVPDLLNWTNVILGSLTLIPMYYLWKKLSNPYAAALSCLFFSITPTYWNANVAGMPHLPSFSFFITSLLFFSTAADKTGWKRSLGFTASAISGVLAVELKADILLCFGAYLTIALIKKRTLLNISLSMLIPFLSFLAVKFHTNCIAPNLPAASDFAANWFLRWPIVLHRNDLIIPVISMGAVFFSLISLGIFYSLIFQKYLPILLLCFIWGLPAILFWSLREGNSIRHMMVSFSILIFFLAVVLVDIMSSPKKILIFGILAVFANYFISPSPADLKSLRGRLLKNTISLQSRVHQMHTAGREFAELADSRKIIAGSESVPYVIWESIIRARIINITWNNKEGIWGKDLEVQLELADNSRQVIRVENIAEKPAKVTAKPGWKTWTCEKEVTIIDES